MSSSERASLTPLDKVTTYHPVYMDYKKQYERSGGYDSNLKLSWEAAVRHMDLLLDALLANVVVVTPVEIAYADALTQEFEAVEDGRGSQ